MRETLSVNTTEVEDTLATPEASETNNDSNASKIEGMTQAEVDAAAVELGVALAFVAEHADVIVVCERLGGVEMTLSAAVNAIWPPHVTGAMIKEGVGSVVAEIERMLTTARPAEKQEEEAVEDEEEVEDELQDSAEEHDKVEQLRPEAAAKSAEAKTDETESKSKAETEKPGADQPESTVGHTDSVVEKAPSVEATRTEAVPEAAVASTLESTDTAVKASTAQAEQPTSDSTEMSEAQALEPEISTAKPATETMDVAPTPLPEAEADEPSPEVEVAISEVEISAEVSESTADDLEEEELIEAYDLASFIEDEEIFIAHEVEGKDDLDLAFEVTQNLETTTEPELDDWKVEAIEPEPADSEAPLELSQNIEEVEASLTELVEKIEAAEPEDLEVANEILSEIIALVESGENELAEEHLSVEKEPEEQLQELFTELFETMEMEYTPELIESLVKLTLKWNLIEEIKKIKDEEDEELQAQDGTHEIIKKILVGISKIKKALMNAGKIGKSAIRLYISSVAADLAVPKAAYAVA